MPESQHTEYKQSWRDEHLKWISGFANAEGGVLVIGKGKEPNEKYNDLSIRNQL